MKGEEKWGTDLNGNRFRCCCNLSRLTESFPVWQESNGMVMGYNSAMPGGAVAATSPVPSIYATVRDYIELTKPRITWLILMSTAIGYFFGARDGWHWLAAAAHDRRDGSDRVGDRGVEPVV